MYTVGGIVFSKCGRDKGKAFVIFSIDGEYLYLVDGLTHKLAKSKKKKCKHVQVTKAVSAKIKEMILNNELILDADVKNELLPYNISEQKNEKSDISV